MGIGVGNPAWGILRRTGSGCGMPAASPAAPCDDAGVADDLMAPVRLLLGEEELLVARAIAAVADAARAEDPDSQVRDIRASELAPAELAELTSPSLFGGRQVVVIRGAQDANKELTAALVKYANNPPEDAVMVIAHSGGGRQKAAVEQLKAAATVVVPCAKVTKASERSAFAKAEVTRAGGRCTAAVAELIIDAVGTDLRELAAVCGQLVADTNGNVTEEAVRRYHRGRAEITGFSVADAALTGDASAALGALRWARSLGVAPVLIADALADGVRTIARVGGARGNSYRLASELGMPPWKVDRAQKQARGWSADGLVTAMRAAAVLNADVKGAAQDEDYALEKAVLTITGARGAH